MYEVSPGAAFAPEEERPKGYKILCIDDEVSIRRYLPVAIDWKAVGIGEMRTASNGKEALGILKEFHPDIAIVDVEMPDMNGLEFCKRASEIQPELKMVILSAFDRFDYAKRAIAIGVEDYILKPVDEDELEQVMKKVVADIEKNRKDSFEREQLTLKALEKEVKELAYCFVRNQKYEADLETTFPVLKGYHNFCLAVQESGEEKDGFEELKNEIPFDAVTVPLETGFLGIFWKKDDRISMIDQLLKLRKHAENKGIHLRFYYTRKKEQESFESAASRCFFAMQSAFYRKEQDIDAGREEFCFRKMELKPPELKEGMNLLEEEGDASLLRKDLKKEVLDAFENQEEPLAICQMLLDVFITLKIYLTKSWQEESLGIFRRMDLWSFLRCGSRETLMRLLEKNIDELQEFLKTQKETHGNLYIVKMAKSYTKEHYQDAGLSLGEVADAVGISRTYFSSIFKELTGEKYWDYLSRCRIEKAKSLLRETGLSQAEISERVGYSSEYHFSRKFKELAGISPNKYRKQS